MRLLVSLLSVLLVTGDSLAAKALRIDLKGEFPGASDSVAFEGQVLIPPGQSRAIFTGAHTLKLSPAVKEHGRYELAVEVLGLGPGYRNSSYTFEPAVAEKIVIPSLPLKNEAVIDYLITIVDDTSSLSSPADSLGNGEEWDLSASVHYLTHWLKGSLADFMWNVKMGWLENIYDQYRHSFRLSIFEKIDFYFHPEWTDEVYLNPRTGYGILPLSRRIDVVYGHDFDAVTPSPAAELLVYRLWGYGPRWMVVGFSHYYDDGQLALRKFAAKLSAEKVTRDFSRHQWLESDTASIFLGGFVNWLLENYSQSDFRNLYRRSSPLDYAEVFADIYKMELEEAVSSYLNFIESYAPPESELSYYASIYMEQRYIEKAGEYYAELAAMDNDDKKVNLEYLATCRFWLGDYRAAEDVYDDLMAISDPDDHPRLLKLKGDMNMALGDFSGGLGLYKEAFNDDNYGKAGLALVTVLIDSEDFESARGLFGRLEGDVLSLPEYSIESARLKIRYGEPGADSLLTPVADRALNAAIQTPQNSRYYLIAGMAFTLLGQYDRAGENLDIANFLEYRPYYQALALLELGRMNDLEGDREAATGYYHRVADSGGGEYLSSLARKYIETPYHLSDEK